MLLIPQLYLRDGAVVRREGTTSPIFQDDPFETARLMKDAGAEAISCIDLSIPPGGGGPHVPIIKRIRNELELAVQLGGTFKTPQAVEAAITAGVEMAVLDSVAYQQPKFLQEVSERFPGRIAVHIDVKAGKVTIPGYTVVANKTPLDYAERFLDAGIRYIFYSDVGADGFMAEENFQNILAFCNQVTTRIICTSEVRNLADIERLTMLGAPRLEGLVLTRALFEGRVDLRGAIAMVNDLSVGEGNEPTLTEM